MIKRLIIWGGLEDKSSHRHVHRAFYDTARKLNIPADWISNSPTSTGAITPGSTVLSADIYGEHLPYVKDVSYVLHNYDGSHPVCQALEQTPERLLRLQVWTDAATGEQWGPCRSFDRQARVLFQPWGSDRLAEEFLDPVFNEHARDVVFVGAVWSDQWQGVELGNEWVIDELKKACAERRLNFVHATQVSDAEHVRLLRGARLTPALAGAWQVEHSYLPCRSFKLPAYGCAMFSNVPAVTDLFGPAATPPPGSLEETLDWMLSLNEWAYFDLVREQQHVAAQFTYRESLEAISRAFEEMRA